MYAYICTYVHSGQSVDTVLWCHHTQHLECHGMGSWVHGQSVGHWIDAQHPGSEPEQAKGAESMQLQW